MMKKMVKKLKKHPDAEIKFPGPEEMVELAAMVQQRDPAVDDVIGFLDGVACPVECKDDEFSQAEDYDGYHHDTVCKNCFLFGPDGKVKWAAINFPGSWHDSSVSRDLINLVILSIGIYKICVDQGFPRGGTMYNKFVGPMSQRTRNKLADVLRGELLKLHNRYVSLRQASEWGMRALQGSFARLKSRMTSDKPKRFLLIYSIVLLHNFRTTHVGLNQIATVFNPHYEQTINIEGYDRISRYYENA